MDKTHKENILPIDMALPERILFDDGVMFVHLRTLDELERFWRENRHRFEYACEGHDRSERQEFLRSYEWIFGKSKAAVVRAVLRWDVMGVGVEFFDFSKHDPEMYAEWFRDRDACRRSEIEQGNWTSDDERNYQADCIRRSPESYKGWWQLKNLPGEWTNSEWFDGWSDREELFDPNMPVATVERILQEQTFDSWQESDSEEIKYHDSDSIDSEIAMWRQLQSLGDDYYGQENEKQ
jgi:hypothetical protein